MAQGPGCFGPPREVGLLNIVVGVFVENTSNAAKEQHEAGTRQSARPLRTVRPVGLSSLSCAGNFASFASLG